MTEMTRAHSSRPWLRRIAVLCTCIGLSSQAFADCTDSRDACVDRADAKESRCSDNCDRVYSQDLDGWERCFDRCTSTNDRETDGCETQLQRCEALEQQDENQQSTTSAPQQAPARGKKPNLYGSKDSGEDGCYFGECPDGNSPPSNPEPKQPRPRPEPQPDPEPDPQPPPQKQAPTTSICQTPTFWCRMYARGPVGYACYCNSSFGPIGGQTVPE